MQLTLLNSVKLGLSLFLYLLLLAFLFYPQIYYSVLFTWILGKQTFSPGYIAMFLECFGKNILFSYVRARLKSGCEREGMPTCFYEHTSCLFSVFLCCFFLHFSFHLFFSPSFLSIVTDHFIRFWTYRHEKDRYGSYSHVFICYLAQT